MEKMEMNELEGVSGGVNIKAPGVGSKFETYRAIIGDSFASVANHFGCTERELIVMNRLDGKILKPGTILKVPVKK